MVASSLGRVNNAKPARSASQHRRRAPAFSPVRADDRAAIAAAAPVRPDPEREQAVIAAGGVRRIEAFQIRTVVNVLRRACSAEGAVGHRRRGKTDGTRAKWCFEVKASWIPQFLRGHDRDFPRQLLAHSRRLRPRFRDIGERRDRLESSRPEAVCSSAPGMYHLRTSSEARPSGSASPLSRERRREFPHSGSPRWSRWRGAANRRATSSSSECMAALATSPAVASDC
jgi:hypothetical protein